MVIQQLSSERDESVKQKKKKEKELCRLQALLVEAQQREQELRRQKEEQDHLEDRIRSFYQSEWEKLQQVIQQEATRWRTETEEKVELLRRQEDDRLQELRRIHQVELEQLQKNLKDSEASFSEQVSRLSAENQNLIQKLQNEEQKSLEPPPGRFLEQELDSLRVVLEMRNQQLQQKQQQLQELQPLAEANVRLQESVTRLRQENEDFRARLDKHAALTKRLSGQQEVLRRSLLSENQQNKRLSLENEELQWRLQHPELLPPPRGHAPIGHAPIGHAPIGHAPIGHAPIGHAPPQPLAPR
ncbi:microtubule-associated tumor suppressor 1 homolog isoform 5-T5 [Menidia menidia]